jgi:anti-anti-sigma regulatory factor
MRFAILELEARCRMLKISLVDGQRQRRLIVEGTLVAPWASELVIACEETRVDLDGRELIVDLRGVTGIGSEGESVLLQLMRDKTKLQCGLFMSEVLRQLARKAPQNSTDAGDAQIGTDSEC